MAPLRSSRLGQNLAGEIRHAYAEHAQIHVFSYAFNFLTVREPESGAREKQRTCLIGGNTKLLADLALKYRLPAVTLFTDFARDGGLMAYGPNIQAVMRQEGVLAAKILLGASPAETPIETPTRFEFVLNLKTAKLLGIVIPVSTLLRADEVIE
jgi:ABC transporter substrate binding protein